MFAVGDDDQSIYAFRGARVGNMADFEREAPRHQVVKLEQNYRLLRQHPRCGQRAHRPQPHRLGKNLRTDRCRRAVRVHRGTSDFAEAVAAGRDPASCTSGIPRAGDRGAIYRSNAQSRVIESALFNAGVPYRVYGGLRFFERAEIKHALAYLRPAGEPNDDTSFLRVVNFRRAASAPAIEAVAGRRARRDAACVCTSRAFAGQGGRQPAWVSSPAGRGCAPAPRA